MRASPWGPMLCLVLLAAVTWSSADAFVFRKDAATLDAALGGLHAVEAFKAWQVKHKKAYSDVQTSNKRFAAWLDNARRVVELNQQKDRKLKLGLNGLADLTPAEFKSKLLSPKPLTPTFGRERQPVTGPADKPVSWRYDHVKPKKYVDWREEGIMGPVRSQHAHNWSCGGCWAFATVGIAEASSALYTGTVVPGSEQQLIDCDDKHDHGCDGGDFHNGLDYIIYNKGLTTEDNYPYAGQTNKCDVKKEKDHQVKVDDWESVPVFNESALVQAITMRPVISAICCGSNLDDWHHYDGGVFDIPCCHDKLELDHAIVLMGYGRTPEGEDYYILKNSWSTEWGEEGYMRIARNVGPKPFVSQCGLASMPTMVFRGPKPPPPASQEHTDPHSLPTATN